MAESADFISAGDAAVLLGVTAQHARRLARAGELTPVTRGLIDRASVDRYLLEHRGGRTRTWSEPVAWGAIAMLSGLPTEWLAPWQSSRVRAALGTMDDPQELVARTRARATVGRYAADVVAVNRLRGLVANPDSPAPHRRTALSNHLDAYISSEVLERVSAELALQIDPSAAITLRSTAFNCDVIRSISVDDRLVLAALDLASSPIDVERRISASILRDELDRFRSRPK